MSGQETTGMSKHLEPVKTKISLQLSVAETDFLVKSEQIDK